MTLQERYEWACADKDIGALIPVLKGYAEQCRHVTEFGVRLGVSTTAWLAALEGLIYPHPQYFTRKTLVCYDVGRYPSVDEIERLAKENQIEFEFHEENTAQACIEPTDLLFIDTVHNESQVRLELISSHQVKKFIILHDTETYGINGEGGARGMWHALIPFLNREPWKIREVRPESNGLTVLERIQCPQ